MQATHSSLSSGSHGRARKPEPSERRAARPVPLGSILRLLVKKQSLVQTSGSGRRIPIFLQSGMV